MTDEVCALQAAIGHLEHMATWIGMTNRGMQGGIYSFESLGEDMPRIRAVVSELKRWRGVIPLVEQITAEEGASVTFVCANPDFNGLPNEAVTVMQGEDWQEITYRADTLADCLRQALQQKGSGQ